MSFDLLVGKADKKYATPKPGERSDCEECSELQLLENCECDGGK